MQLDNDKCKTAFSAISLIFLLVILASCARNSEIKVQNNTIKVLNNLSNPPIETNKITLADNRNPNSVFNNGQSYQSSSNNHLNGLLSPRVYAGILEPKSFLINNFQPLRKGLQSYMELNDINGSVYIENLRNGVSIGINQNRGYFPASLNKLPIAIMIMQKIEDRKLSFDTKMPILDWQRTDSSGTLYLTPAKELTVRELLEAMLKESDNTAFNVLYYNVDKQEFARLLNYYDVDINVDYPERRIEFINHTDLVTPKSLYNIFSSLYLSTVLAPPEDSEYLLSLLANTTFDIKSMANLPRNVTVTQKYGEYYADDAEFFHDCGIMYIGVSRIFYCIMTRNANAVDAQQDIAYMVNYIYNYVVDTRGKLDQYREQQ